MITFTLYLLFPDNFHEDVLIFFLKTPISDQPLFMKAKRWMWACTTNVEGVWESFLMSSHYSASKHQREASCENKTVLRWADILTEFWLRLFQILKSSLTAGVPAAFKGSWLFWVWDESRWYADRWRPNTHHQQAAIRFYQSNSYQQVHKEHICQMKLRHPAFIYFPNDS